MSPATERISALSRHRYWAGLLLCVLILDSQLQPGQAVACPPSRPADKPHAATTPKPPIKIDVLLVQVHGRLARQFAQYLLGHSKQGSSDAGNPMTVYCGILDSARDARAFQGFMKELQRHNLAKVLGEPSLVTFSDRQVSFLEGGERAVPVPKGSGSIGVQFEEFGTRINCLPTLLDTGKIHLEIEPEVSQLDPASGTTIGGAVVPGRVCQRVRTTVEIEDGQTLVLGGLVQHQVSATEERVPILGGLPLVGAAFTNKSFQQNETELLLMITAHLIAPIDTQPESGPVQGSSSDDEFEQFLDGILEAPAAAGKQPQTNKGQVKKYIPASSSWPGRKQPQTNKGQLDREVTNRLEQMERQLKKLQKEIDGLHRELRSRE